MKLQVVTSVKDIQDKIHMIEISVAHDSWMHTKFVIGMLGIISGIAGIMSAQKYHHKIKRAAVSLLSAANVTVGLLNWGTLVVDYFGWLRVKPRA